MAVGAESHSTERLRFWGAHQEINRSSFPRSRDAWIRNRITDRKMINDLSLGGCQIEVVVHFIIVEGADTGCAQSKRFRGEIECLANSAGFKMHVAITQVAIVMNGTIEIADHRKAYASVTGEALTEAESSCN